MQKLVGPIIGDYTYIETRQCSKRYLQIDITGEEPYEYLFVMPTSYTLYSDVPGLLPDPTNSSEIYGWDYISTEDPRSVIFEQYIDFNSYEWFFAAPLYYIYTLL